MTRTEQLAGLTQELSEKVPGLKKDSDSKPIDKMDAGELRAYIKAHKGSGTSDKGFNKFVGKKVKQAENRLAKMLIKKHRNNKWESLEEGEDMFGNKGITSIDAAVRWAKKGGKSAAAVVKKLEGLASSDLSVPRDRATLWKAVDAVKKDPQKFGLSESAATPTSVEFLDEEDIQVTYQDGCHVGDRVEWEGQEGIVVAHVVGSKVKIKLDSGKTVTGSPKSPKKGTLRSVQSKLNRTTLGGKINGNVFGGKAK